MHIHAAMRLALFSFFAAASFLVNPASAGDVENPALSAALNAFDADPNIERQLAELESRGYVRAPVQTIGLGGGCGVAGCDSSFLVAVNFSHERDLPAQILATVTVRAPGFTVVNVRMVQLAPVFAINSAPEAPAQ